MSLNRKTGGQQKGSLAVFTMVYNEEVMLPVWVKVYSAQVGAENLYILDHRSDVTPYFEGVTVKVLKRGELDEIQRLKTVKAFQSALLERYDYVLFTDCDEFVIADPLYHTSLQDYVRQLNKPYVRCVGVDVLEHQEGLAPVDWNQSILSQRPYGALRRWSYKTLLSSEPLSWRAGFHECDDNPDLDEHLWLFHLKSADKKHLLQRLALTRRLNWSKRALAEGHGGSHRISDATMERSLKAFQNRREEELIDAEPGRLASIVTGPSESALYKIPERFLQII